MLLNRGVLAAFLHHLRKSCAQLAPVKPSQVLHMPARWKTSCIWLCCRPIPESCKQNQLKTHVCTLVGEGC